MPHKKEVCHVSCPVQMPVLSRHAKAGKGGVHPQLPCLDLRDARHENGRGRYHAKACVACMEGEVPVFAHCKGMMRV